MSVSKKVFCREDMDFYLKELGKELKKEYGRNASFELILVGGGAIALQYGFRDSTTDLDALISSSIKSSINNITDRYSLPEDWLNTDFVRTVSYSPKIREHSRHYRTFGGVLEVRVVSDEYLIAMKLRAFRQYRHDISDVIGIIAEMKNAGEHPSMDGIGYAFHELYGEDAEMPEDAEKLLSGALSLEDPMSLYNAFSEREAESYRAVVEAQEAVPAAVLEKYINDIIGEKVSGSLEEFLDSLDGIDDEPEIEDDELER